MPYAIRKTDNNGGAGYYVGSRVELTAEFLSNTGAAVAPTTVAIAITRDGTSVATGTYALGDITQHEDYYAADDIVYRYLFSPTTAGEYVATFTSTGSGQAVEKQVFTVHDI